MKTADKDIAISPSVGSDTIGSLSIHVGHQKSALTVFTTYSTKVMPAETPLAAAFKDVMTSYKGEIICAFATITHTCPQNHTLIKVNPGLKNTLCAPCEMHYKNTTFCIKCEAIITVELSDSSKKVWILANSCFAKVVPPQLWTTKEDVIQHLLDLNMVDFKVRNNEISCSPCPITRVITAL